MKRNWCFSKRCFLAMALFWLVLPSSVAFPQEIRLYSAQAGECELRVEAAPDWRWLRLRAFNPSGKTCRIGKQDVLSALGGAVAQALRTRPGGGPAYLYLGRLVDYPWLSQYLAETAGRDPAFDTKTGKPRSKHLYKYVVDILGAEDALKPVSDALAEGGYRVSGVSVEKVLTGTMKDIPGYHGKTFTGRAPFDAQVWCRLERR